MLELESDSEEEDSPVVSPTARKHIRMQMVKNAYKFEILEEHIDHIYIPLLLGLEPNKEILREHLRLIDERVIQLNDLGVKTDQKKYMEQIVKNISQAPDFLDKVEITRQLHEVSSKLEEHNQILDAARAIAPPTPEELLKEEEKNVQAALEKNLKDPKFKKLYDQVGKAMGVREDDKAQKRLQLEKTLFIFPPTLSQRMEAYKKAMKRKFNRASAKSAKSKKKKKKKKPKKKKKKPKRKK